MTTQQQNKYQPLFEFLVREYEMDEDLLDITKCILENKKISSPKILKLVYDDEINEYFVDYKLIGRAIIEYKHHVELNDGSGSKKRKQDSEQSEHTQVDLCKKKKLKKSEVTPETYLQLIREREEEWNKEFRKNYFIEVVFQDSKSVYCPLRDKVFSLSRSFKISNLNSAYKLLRLRQSSPIKKLRANFLKRYYVYLRDGKNKEVTAQQLKQTIITHALRNELETWEKSQATIATVGEECADGQLDLDPVDNEEGYYNNVRTSSSSLYELNRKVADYKLILLEKEQD